MIISSIQQRHLTCGHIIIGSFHAQMLDGIVHTTHHHRSIDVVACRADDKDVAYALIEKQLDRYARVGAAYHSGKRSLMGSTKLLTHFQIAKPARPTFWFTTFHIHKKTYNICIQRS